MTEVVRGPGLRCEVQPDRGARIVSLRGDDGCEWLAASERTASPGPGQPFVRQGMGGWDEVAPTVQTDREARDGAGRLLGELPDHGDVWNVAWQVKAATSTALTASVRLSSLPVVLERSIAATTAGLSLSYRASTASEAALPLLWCAHPQFAAPPGTVVSLESGGVPISPSLTEMYPDAGKPRAFPAGPMRPALAPGSSLKAFVNPGVRVDAAVLRGGGTRALRIQWSAEQLPYLGLFWDNGEFAAEPVVAVEPSTAWGEKLSTAAGEGRVLTLRRGRPLEWALHLSATNDRGVG
jgi:galactose mutarotase-like enzyme